MFQSAESRYNRWVRDHYRFLLRSAWAMTGSRAVGEDVVQDCFTSAWKHRDQLRQPELARAWLFQIMRREAFFDRGGMVTVFAFDQPPGLEEGRGWWGNVYWQVVTSSGGNALLLVAEHEKALAVAHGQFARPSG